MEKASKMTDFWCLWSEIREKGEAKWVAKSDIYDQSHFYIKKQPLECDLSNQLTFLMRIKNHE